MPARYGVNGRISESNGRMRFIQPAYGAAMMGDYSAICDQ
jgi:hypothetical protein